MTTTGPVSHQREHVVVDGDSLSLDDVARVARGQAMAVLSTAPELRERIERSSRFVAELVASGRPAYGITTGVGDSASQQVAADRAAAMQRNLVLKCGCGSGPHLSPEEARAAVLVRANCLAKGYSGVRPTVIERLLEMLEHDLVPLIPEQGSVGASGDLVPGSYIAAVLIGEREVLFRGERLPSRAAWAEIGRQPIELEAKEGLALINGTMVSAGIASLALVGAERLARLADLCTAMACEALAAIYGPYDPFFERVKRHPGLARSAGALRRLLEGSRLVRGYEQMVAALEPLGEGSKRLPSRIQDSYSLRCAPHCTGALYDAVAWGRQWLEIEVNSTNDNPILDPEEGRIHSGGNFSGFHVGLAMDGLKLAVASVADQADRQLALLVDEKFNNGLSPNLVAPLPAEHPEYGIHHGFKAVQIATSALAAEAQHRALPATVFSRSTECHNQDKVSQSTIAARQLRDVVEIAERCCVAHLLACCQAVELRGADRLGKTRAAFDRVRGVSAFVDRDRGLEREIEAVHALLREGELLDGLFDG